MIEAFKVMHRGYDRLWSYVAQGKMEREYVKDQETTGCEGTQVLVFDTLQRACDFIAIAGNPCCEIWSGEARDVVAPLLARELGQPDCLSNPEEYSAYWRRVRSSSVQDTTPSLVADWPPGTLAVLGFTPREKVWDGWGQQDNQ